MKSLNYFLIAIFSLLNSCDTDKSQTPDIYNFLLAQPDGSVPDSGYAIIYEKQIDPVTGFSTISVPVSDTIVWNEDQFSWVDNRDETFRPLLIKTFSPDEYTASESRFISLDVVDVNNEVFFPQSRPLELIVRDSNTPQLEADAWAIIITPSVSPLVEVDGASSVALSQFNDFTSVEKKKIHLSTEVYFHDQSIMYCHLFRFDGSIWHESDVYTVDILSTEGKFMFNKENFISCYE